MMVLIPWSWVIRLGLTMEPLLVGNQRICSSPEADRVLDGLGARLAQGGGGLGRRARNRSRRAHGRRYERSVPGDLVPEFASAHLSPSCRTS